MPFSNNILIVMELFTQGSRLALSSLDTSQECNYHEVDNYDAGLGRPYLPTNKRHLLLGIQDPIQSMVAGKHIVTNDTTKLSTGMHPETPREIKKVKEHTATMHRISRILESYSRMFEDSQIPQSLRHYSSQNTSEISTLRSYIVHYENENSTQRATMTELRRETATKAGESAYVQTRGSGAISGKTVSTPAECRDQEYLGKLKLACRRKHRGQLPPQWMLRDG
ncbi:hypothetical protein EDC01DRAFT_635321 [Geopyxis carbonaria]|nr:hypothetical protein EDC01DRAFT_635321 [Geopyxis carbonaria]